MQDRYLRDYFRLHGQGRLCLNMNEESRVAETQKLVPGSWLSIIDIGCGDGRVTRELGKCGIEILGIDWSDTSLRQFIGKKIVADIRKPLPIRKMFDGAICAEVLEHLPIAEAREIIANIKSISKQGFIISVPAREQLQTHTVWCPVCHRPYHIYGHLNRFETFEDVDALVGQKSSQRILVHCQGLARSVIIGRFMRFFGYYPYLETAICPFCGNGLETPGRPPLWQLGPLWLLGRLEELTNFLRPPAGWFICRYDK